MDALFMWYHRLWFPPTMVSPQAIWFSLPSLFSIFPASYLWKWQRYLQPLYPWICRCGGSTVVEIISGLAMDCGEWSGERAHGFVCETSSSVVVGNSLTSCWKWAGAAGCTGTPLDWEEEKMDGTGKIGEKEKKRMTSNGVRREWRRQRKMVMSCANDESTYSVLRGVTALGTASRPYFLQLFFPVWPATSQWRRTEDVCEASHLLRG